MLVENPDGIRAVVYYLERDLEVIARTDYRKGSHAAQTVADLFLRLESSYTMAMNRMEEHRGEDYTASVLWHVVAIAIEEVCEMIENDLEDVKPIRIESVIAKMRFAIDLLRTYASATETLILANKVDEATQALALSREE